MFSYNTNNAMADIRGGTTYPNIKGQVSFKEIRNGVIVTAQIYGLPISKNNCIGKFFGFHIHEGSSPGIGTSGSAPNIKNSPS